MHDFYVLIKYFCEVLLLQVFYFYKFFHLSYLYFLQDMDKMCPFGHILSNTKYVFEF